MIDRQRYYTLHNRSFRMISKKKLFEIIKTLFHDHRFQYQNMKRSYIVNDAPNDPQFNFFHFLDSLFKNFKFQALQLSFYYSKRTV